MTNKIKGVCIKVHPNFFSLFENKRKNYESKLKVNLSQIQTSELMSKEFIKKLNPRVNVKNNKKYYPKKPRQRGIFYPSNFAI